MAGKKNESKAAKAKAAPSKATESAAPKSAEKEKVPDVTVGADFTRRDPLIVDGREPEKHYRWVAKKKLESRKAEGYIPARSEEIHQRFPEQEKDGNVQYRDLILCEMPEERAEKRKEFLRNRAQRMSRAATEEFHRAGRKSGIRTEEDGPRKKYFFMK